MTQADEYKEVVKLYTKSQDMTTVELMNQLVALIGSNNYDENNSVLATILDFTVEYTDDATTPERRRILAKAVDSLVDAIK